MEPVVFVSIVVVLEEHASSNGTDVSQAHMETSFTPPDRYQHVGNAVYDLMIASCKRCAVVIGKDFSGAVARKAGSLYLKERSPEHRWSVDVSCKVCVTFCCCCAPSLMAQLTLLSQDLPRLFSP